MSLSGYSFIGSERARAWYFFIFTTMSAGIAHTTERSLYILRNKNTPKHFEISLAQIQDQGLIHHFEE